MAGKAELSLHPEDDQRFVVKELQPLDPQDRGQLVKIRSWFRNPKIGRHLFGVPDQLDELADYYRNTVHGFLGVNELGEYVSVGALRPSGDPNRMTRTFAANLERFCVRPDMQGKGIGKQTALLFLDKAFSSPEEGGFGYGILGLGVLVGPKDWQYAYRLFNGVGFRFTGWHTSMLRGNYVITMEITGNYFDEIVRPMTLRPRGNFFR